MFLEALKEKARTIPWPLLITVYTLVGLGLFNLYSATGAHLAPGRFYTQVNWVLVGTLVVVIIGVVIDIRTVERFTFLGYLAVCLMLVGVDFFGTIINGSQRWLVIGPVRLQPSEPAKIAAILMVARSFAQMKGYNVLSLFDLWRQIILVGVPSFLILKHPDLGTAGLVAMIAGVQTLFVRVEWKSVLIVTVAAVSASLVAWNFVLLPYQKARVINFLNPMGDPQGAGYHSIQSMIAVGSGGIMGRGFQQGTQSQLNFLPERHTDFIFSVLAEEHGFIGCALIFFLFAALILQCFQIAERSRDTFGALVALGVAAFFAFHFAINVSMILGLFPVVGVPLSLISYGGSHLITSMVCVGLLVAIERRRLAA